MVDAAVAIEGAMVLTMGIQGRNGMKRRRFRIQRIDIPLGYDKILECVNI